jgi:hypothetical protein
VGTREEVRIMRLEYQARWISKRRLDAIRRTRESTRGIPLDSFNGFLMVEPVGSNLGDGPVLSREEADFELRPVWCSGTKARLRDARELLGLDPEAVNEEQLAETVA